MFAWTLIPSLRWPGVFGPKSEMIWPLIGHWKRPRPSSEIWASVGGGAAVGASGGPPVVAGGA
jgi:hypothetical protein